MDDVWGNFQDELEHYRGQTTKYLALLRDETNWKVNGLEVECDEAENTTQLLNTANELIAGHTHSFDSIVTALWRHGKPVDIPNPFPAIGAVMAPYATSLQTLWRREDSPSLKLVEYADCLASLMRALEHYLAVLREGIAGCSEWSTLWADPFAQFRERYNDWLLACERHFSTVLRDRAPTFSRLADGVTIRNGAPAGGPLLTSGTFSAGEAFLATDTIRKLIATATTDVLIVDNYSSADTLSLLFSASPVATARVLTSNIKPDYGTMAARYHRERGATSLETRTTNTIHDRYIVVDGTTYYHVGATLKDLGTKLFSFTKKSDAAEIAKIQASLAAAWSSATVVS
jgi:hypothetical protein